MGHAIRTSRTGSPPPRPSPEPGGAAAFTPELLTVARKCVAEQGYDDIKWKEGDAEDLPFPDGAFDVVVSSCGLMFAPDQQKVAKPLARVTRFGGRIAIQAWTREGY